MTVNDLTLTVTFKVDCGGGRHEASITLTAWGAIEFSTSCEVAMLPPTVRKLSNLKWYCEERLSMKVRWLAWDFFIGTAQSERTCLCLPSRVREQGRAFISQWQGQLKEGAMAKLAQEGFDPPTEDALRKALHSGNLHLQCAAAVLAGVQKQTSLIADLLETAQKQSSFCFKLAVLWALAKMPDCSPLEDFLCENFAVKDLTMALRDGSEVVQKAAAKALGRLKSVDAVPFLIKALKQASKKEVRDAIMQALVSIGEPAILHLVKDLERERDEEIWRAETEVLKHIKSLHAVKPIIKILESVRNAWAYDLLKGVLISLNELAVPELVKALDDESPIVRQMAIESLAELQNLKLSKLLKKVLAIKPLIKALLKASSVKDKKSKKIEKIYQATTNALLSIGEPAVVPLLEALDKTGSAEIKEVLLKFPPDILKKVMRKIGKKKQSLLEEILKGVHD